MTTGAFGLGKRRAARDGGDVQRGAVTCPGDSAGTEPAVWDATGAQAEKTRSRLRAGIGFTSGSPSDDAGFLRRRAVAIDDPAQCEVGSN